MNNKQASDNDLPGIEDMTKMDDLKACKQERFLVPVVIVLLFLVLLIGSGSLFSGYHLVDDYYAIRAKQEIAEKGLFSTVQDSIERDLSWRFRPLFWAVIALRSFFFGADMNCWMILTMLEGMLTTWFLYRSFRNFGISTKEAGILSAIAILGQQYDVWVRAIHQENTGYFLLSLVLFLLSLSESNGVSAGKKKLCRAAACLTAILCSWQKESFTLMLPAMLLLLAHFEIDKRGNRFLQALKNRWVEITILSLVLIMNLYAVLFVVGTDKVSYAGFHQNIAYDVYFSQLWRTVSHRILYLTGFMVLMLFCIVFFCVRSGQDHAADRVRETVGKNRWLLLCGIYIILSQLAMHARSGMSGRYIIPFILGFLILAVIFPLRISHNDKVWYNCTAIFLALLSIYCLCISWSPARSWAYSGARHRFLLTTLKETLESYPDKREVLLFLEFGDGVTATVYWEDQFFPDVHWIDGDKSEQLEEIRNREIIPDVIVCGRHAFNTDEEDGVFPMTGLTRDDYERVVDDEETWIVMAVSGSGS